MISPSSHSVVAYYEKVGVVVYGLVNFFKQLGVLPLLIPQIDVGVVEKVTGVI